MGTDVVYSADQMIKEIAFKTGIPEDTVRQIPEEQLQEVFDHVEAACDAIVPTGPSYLGAAFATAGSAALGWLATVIPNSSMTSMPTGARVAQMAILTGIAGATLLVQAWLGSRGNKAAAEEARDEVLVAAGKKEAAPVPYVPLKDTQPLPGRAVA